ncbi:LacI family DNA-binding transcriptional regulator [Paenibacillus naphthalenovorans]|uniref:LacI family DNA-binding transcriptional regulator n=1 Tax=Paenibacillus naphthalenovorans TaxID=162209 RepID=UPI003D2D0A3D
MSWNAEESCGLRKLTIKDVAKHAGVSTATISRVLNGSGYVSEDVRRQVLASVKELNYRPNAIARSLKQEKSRSIGMILPDMSNPYFMTIARTIQQRLVAEGYRLLFMDSDENPDKEREALDALLSNRVEGLLLAGTGGNKEQLRQLIGSGIPVVLVDRCVPGVSADLVMEDNRGPVRQAMEYLVSAGHRHIGMIHGPKTISTALERYEAAVRALQEAGFQVGEEYVYSGDFSRKSGKQAIQKLMKLPVPPTAVFSANNEMTFGLYLGLQEMGIGLDEVEVVSFGDLDFSSLFKHRLSVIMQHPESIGDSAAGILLDKLLHQKSAMENRIIIPQFVQKNKLSL